MKVLARLKNITLPSYFDGITLSPSNYILVCEDNDESARLTTVFLNFSVLKYLFGGRT